MVKNILIAGGTGVIGSHLLTRLINNFSVSVIARSQKNYINNLIQFDITDLDQVNSFINSIKTYDILIFLVGLVHKKKREINKYNEVNYNSLVNLLDGLNKSNKIPEKIIFSSTISVYGEKNHQSSYDETAEKTPFSPYAVTKLEAEQYLLDNYAEKSWVLRFAPVYSPDFRLNIERRTKIGNWFYCVGNGTAKLSLCNIENIGITVKAAISGQVPPGVYNISDTIEYTYNDILENQNAKWILPIPRFIVKTAYTFGKMTGNIFLKENAVKLLTDNVYPSNKIRSYVNFSATLNNSI